MDSHHAIVFTASSVQESAIPEEYKIQSNDVTHVVADRFGIDEARALSRNSLQKPIDSDTRVFVVATQSLPVESQNALLKLFEEPPEHVQFYLIIPQVGMLIPTLRSRVLVRETLVQVSEINTSFVSFLADSYAGRMATVLDITKKKDLQAIEKLLVGSEEYIASNSKLHRELLKTVLFVRSYIKTPGASAKMLLEELALALPRE